MMKIINEERIAKAVKDWIDQDYSVRSIQVNRGYWEDIAPVIAQAQLESCEEEVKDEKDLLQSMLTDKDVSIADCKGLIDMWRKEALKLREEHKREVGEIFEDIEDLSPVIEIGNDLAPTPSGFPQAGDTSYYPKIALKDWVALRRKWGVK